MDFIFDFGLDDPINPKFNLAALMECHWETRVSSLSTPQDLINRMREVFDPEPDEKKKKTKGRRKKKPYKITMAMATKMKEILMADLLSGDRKEEYDSPWVRQ